MIRRAFAALLTALLAAPAPVWSAAARSGPAQGPAARPVPGLPSSAPRLSLPPSAVGANASLGQAPQGPAAAPGAAPAAAPAAKPAPKAVDARASAPDPRGEGFEDAAWSDAERQGLARKPAETSADAPAASSPVLDKPGAAAASPKPSVPAPTSVLAPRVLGFFSAFALVQVTVESLALAVPQMSDPLTQGFLALGAVSALSYVSYAVGSVLAGRWLERIGIDRAYRAVLTIRTALWASAAFLFDPATQTIPLAALTIIFALDYFAHSIGRVAEHTLQVSWFKDSPVTSARFGAMRDFVEYFTVFTVLGAGLLIAAYGFGAVVYATPVMFGAAAVISFFLRGLPRAAAETVKQLTARQGFQQLFATAARARLFLGQLLINGFLYLLYYVSATAFAAFAAPGDKGQIALIASALMSVYGIGALFATAVMAWVSNRIEKRTASLPEAEKAAAQNKELEGTARPALYWAAAALALGAWGFTLLEPLGRAVWPVYALMPALAVIGLTGQVALNHLDTLLKSELPRETAASVLGSARALMNLGYALSFVFWGWVFDAFREGGFMLLAMASMASAATYVWLAGKLGKK